ncbi:MAG: TolC family outer membrane protein [Proteobacteria bacterium]|nr:TolC family outer membrane protein [Pseudomonadota bacterium]
MRSYFFVVCAVLAVSSPASAVFAQSLEAELRGLATDHPMIKSAEAQRAAGEQGLRATLSPFLPTLDVTGGNGYERINTPAFRASPDGPFDTDAENYALTLRENIFDGGRKFANRRAARLQLNVLDLSLTNTRQNILYEGATAYINVLRQAELVTLTSQNGDNIRKQLNLEDERVRRGSGISVDVLQAKSRLQFSMERFVATRGALDEARARYLQVFSHPPEQKGMALPPPPDHLLPKTVDEAVAIALAENAQVESANKRIDIGNEQRDAINAEYYPSLDIVLQSKYERDFNGAPGIRRDKSAKVQATWTLFSGLSTQSRAAQAAADTDARRADYQQARRKVEEQTRLAWHSLQTANERVGLLENAVNIASEVFGSRTKLREAGKETVINVLDAENEVFSARINYASALYDARLAAYQLLLAIGRLEVDAISPGAAAK